jgi:hypothetical protein
MSSELSPLLTTQINSENMIMNIWHTYFQHHHQQIINAIRTNAATHPELQAILGSVLPNWPDFVNNPTQNSLLQYKNQIDKLLQLKEVQVLPDVVSAINLFIEQYNLMLKQLAPKKIEERNNKKPQTSSKVKQLQQLLNVSQTGLWNRKSDDALLKWLKDNKWDKYIKNNRFTGNVQDAINAMSVQKIPEMPTDLSDLSERQAVRKERLNKIAAEILQFPKTEPVPEQHSFEAKPDIGPFPHMNKFMHGYVEGMLATNTDDNSVPFDRTYSVEDIEHKSLMDMLEDCKEFESVNESDLDSAEEAGVSEYKLGLLFCYSRNRHGTGFWDEGLGDIGTKLHDAAKKFGEYNLILGGDDKIYGMGG